MIKGVIPVGLTKEALDYIITVLEEIALKNNHKDRDSVTTRYHRELEENLKSIRSNQNEKS
jgi:hypothetical protein|tara:strand:+ start:443 stop:625 length:183 start_codon:yes stop_codon:yes gene_type:complete